MVKCERKHAFHETNKRVDALAKWGCKQAKDFVTFHLPSSEEVSILVNLDTIGLYSIRLFIVVIYVFEE